MRRLLPVVVLAGSCVDGPAPDLEVELGSRCARVALEVRDPAVLPGWQVHALALEREEEERAWALATDGEGRLQLVAWPDEEAYDFSTVADVRSLQLVPGATEGQTWVMFDGGAQAQVWRVGGEGLRTGPRLFDFPEAGTWMRRLVFLDGAAYVLSVPASGTASTLEVSLSRLDDTLAPEPAVRLPLWQACPEEMMDCGPALLTGELTVELLGTTEGGSIGGAAALIGMSLSPTAEPVETSSAHATLVMTVEMRSRGAGLPPRIVRHDLPYFLTTRASSRVSPAFIAADSQALYWLVGLQAVEEGATQPQLDLVYRARRDGLGGAQVMATAAKEQRSHLLQVGSQVAFGQITDTTWTIAPIDAKGVAVSLTGSLALDPGSQVSLAGRGQFLVRSNLGARRVAVACAGE